MPKKTPNTSSIKAEAVSPTIKGEAVEQSQSRSETNSLPPGLDTEDGEITVGEDAPAQVAFQVKKDLSAGSDEVTASSGSGLPTSSAQLDQAKDIVLDLLGWGVTPEYLVEVGVSSAALYAIFNDLHLRLPQNLDTNSFNPSHPAIPSSVKVDTQIARQKSPVLPPKLARS